MNEDNRVSAGLFRSASTPQHLEIIEKWRTTSGSNWGYFAQAEDESWLQSFWKPNGRYRPLFDRLDVSCVVELACGQGRHSLMIVDQCKKLWLVDSSIDALKVASTRFIKHRQVEVILSSDGLTFPHVANSSATAVFSYDAMVHFEPLTVASYIAETARVLVPGGRGLFHHSNFAGNPTGRIDESPGWRNYMTADLFAHFLSRNGLRILDQTVFDRESINGDAITLFEKY